MKHYKLKTGKGELNSTSGNHLCGLLLGNLPKDVLPPNFQPRRSDAIADRDILLSQIGLLCNGRTDFNDIDLYRSDEVFMNAYGLKAIASESVFRQRFDDLPAQRTHAALRKLNTRLLSRRTFGRVEADGLDLVPVDMDVSPFDNSGSSKQGVSFTYKKHDGYAPMFSYIGTQGYMLDCELRPGKQHCQSGTPESIRRSTATLKRLGLEGHSTVSTATTTPPTNSMRLAASISSSSGTCARKAANSGSPSPGASATSRTRATARTSTPASSATSIRAATRRSRRFPRFSKSLNGSGTSKGTTC